MTLSHATSFGTVGERYARFRPGFPPSVCDALAAEVKVRALAVDVATGSGQLAVALAPHFEAVLGVDSDSRMLAHACECSGVTYATSPADRLPVAAHSVGLVSVANAIHWIDTAGFRSELERVLVHQGVFAILKHGSPVLPKLVHDLDAEYRDVLRPYADARLDVHNLTFAEVPLGFDRDGSFDGYVDYDWTWDHYLGLLATFSAASAYQAARGLCPTSRIAARVRDVWGEGRRPVRFPVHARWAIRC